MPGFFYRWEEKEDCSECVAPELDPYPCLPTALEGPFLPGVAKKGCFGVREMPDLLGRNGPFYGGDEVLSVFFFLVFVSVRRS